jgi:protein-S-isoprenylcysteine O-methyltransferase Ste14
VSIFSWFALEVGLVVRDLVRGRARLGRDRGTRATVALAVAVSIFFGTVLGQRVPALDTPAPYAFAAAGLVVIWVGLAVRVWAVLTLGGSFSTFIQVDVEQPVVTRGPCRWVRHPSYTALLIVALGSRRPGIRPRRAQLAVSGDLHCRPAAGDAAAYRG